ncbi:aminotransferase class I/II-fold pyridoxal phosphate-dependent enzyme [Candidatus Nomurabacteria bacterium]|nr:aminotransferase class I/II-fold pyridoxal phosphate-dependent enzyme [Candidatus Kaiserbacteria bacterium]MCB9811107.1 aminotransferase class I/II-fold pyridoxal phosphate-dependent enzyme [Candidatus Nomurabacteria bacterium]MCB9814457.1 aminotransferase class I/II-fold pyridoxal phosphate-dependent enzyme [Candidatus Nomurabacteria bacterium]
MSKTINPKDYQHPAISQEIVDSVGKQLREDISIYDNGGIFKEVENGLKQLFELEHAVVCCNGTSALYSMYYGAGITHGDEVIVPAYTFFATASPLFLLGAIPILADCDESGNIDPKSVLEKITNKTKAIVITHMWGIPGQMSELAEIAEQHDILLLEDVSHAHGATYDGKVIGSFSDGAAWSLQGKKLLTSGEGGLFATRHQKFFERAILLGHFNKRAKLEVHLPEHVAFTTTGLGANLRMHPLGAAVLLPQIRNFPQQLAERREVAAFLTDAISSIDGLSNVPVADNVNPAWYAFNFKFDQDAFEVSREKFVEILVSLGGIEFDIPGSTCPLNMHPLFTRPQDVCPEYAEYAGRFEKGDYPKADAFHASVIKLPTWYGENYMEYAKYHVQILKECADKTKR